MGQTQNLRIFSMAAALIVGFWIPLRLVGMNIPYSVDVYLDLVVSAASIVSLVLHFKERELSPRPPKNWLSLTVALDLLCVLPISLVFPSFLTLNLFAARHVWRIKAFLDEFDSLQPVVYRLVPIAMTMPLLVHLVACGWIALGSGTAGHDPDQVFEYVKAVYWSFTTLTTVGYGDITAKTPPQMLYACVVQITGVGVFGFVLSNVASVLARLDAAREHHMENLDQMETFMSSYRIPRDLRGKVRAYYHYLWQHHKGYNDRNLLSDLPAKMKSDLLLCINRSIVEKVPLLKGASSELIEDLMNELRPRICVPGEKIFKIDEPGDALYFIHGGEVEIQGRDHQVLAKLTDGAFFGEMALVSDKPRNATASAAAYCDLYVLPKASFQRALETYPDFGRHVEEVIRARGSKAA